MAPRFLHRAFCAVLVLARRSGICAREIVCVRVICIMRASEYDRRAAQVRVHIPMCVFQSENYGACRTICAFSCVREFMVSESYMAEFIQRFWLARALESIIELLRSVFISQNEYCRPTIILYVVQYVRSVVFANVWSQNRTWLNSSRDFGLLVPQNTHFRCSDPCLYDLKSYSSLQVILVRGTIPAHIDQRGSGPNATLKSNCAKFS